MVIPSQFEENLDQTHFKEVWQYAEATAEGKAKEVAQRMQVSSDLMSFIRSAHSLSLSLSPQSFPNDFFVHLLYYSLSLSCSGRGLGSGGGSGYYSGECVVRPVMLFY